MADGTKGEDRAVEPGAALGQGVILDQTVGSEEGGLEAALELGKHPHL